VTVFGEELFRRTRFKFWALSPCVVFGMAAILSPGGPGDGPHLASVLLCEAAGLLLLLSLWPYHRIPYVRRTLAGLVALAYVVYALDALWPELFGVGRGSSNPGLALAGFLVIGLPCTVYLVRGRFRWRMHPVAIDPDDPLLAAASAEARARLPRLFEVWPGAAATRVRFSFEVDAAREDLEEEGPLVEHLWGEVLALEPGTVRVRVLTPPLQGGLDLETLDVSLNHVSDWEVEHRDGSLEGNFTTRALVAVAERDGWEVPAEVLRRLRRQRSVEGAPAP
jgi:hypothetical protein